MGKRTPLYQMHLAANAKIVDFAGWDMPLHYGSQLEEHHQVRKHAGMFDVSHMGIIDLHGASVAKFLRFVLANDVNKIHYNQALYTCMLNEAGFVLDDLIVYKISNDFYRLIVNAGTRDKDILWIKRHARAFSVDMLLRDDLVMLAVQGPEAAHHIQVLFPTHQVAGIMALKPFHFLMMGDWFIARTGYTGEDGYEIIFPIGLAEKTWQLLLSQAIKPCGLGARDTLRLEAGLNLYGADMDETVTPYEANLAWTVSLQDNTRQFIGRDSLLNQVKKGVTQQLVGLILSGPGVMRNHQKVTIQHDGVGEITSGGYSPTLEKSIALARLPLMADSNLADTACFVEIRHKQVPARLVKPPFVRRGKMIGA